MHFKCFKVNAQQNVLLFCFNQLEQLPLLAKSFLRFFLNSIIPLINCSGTAKETRVDKLKLVRHQEVQSFSLACTPRQPCLCRWGVGNYLPSTEGQGEDGVPGVGEGAAVGRDGVNTLVEGRRAQTRCLEHPETTSYEWVIFAHSTSSQSLSFQVQRATKDCVANRWHKADYNRDRREIYLFSLLAN